MYAAIDIGGTKTLVAVFDNKGTLLESVKFPTPVDYNVFKQELAKNVATLKHQDFKAAAIAAPGKIDRARGIAIVFGNLPWRMVPVQEDAEAVLHCPVVIENDAKLAALSEAILVKDKYRKALYITVSTGIGGGFIVDGKISPDFEDMEIGQILLEHEGKLERWEEFASGKAFQAKYDSRVGDMDAGNTAAWYWLGRNLAIGMIDLIATLTPDVIIIGGGAGSHLDKFYDRLIEQLKIYENPLLTVPPIQVAQHPEEAVTYGCYELAKSRYGQA